MADVEGAAFALPGTAAQTEEGLALTPRFDHRGLVTAAVTDVATGILLMIAHMDREALDLTIRTGVAHYFSRSRNRIWKKGETSGAVQHVSEIRVDCDQDAIWLLVEVAQPDETCHTHRTTCFYRTVVRDGDGRGLAFALPSHPNAAPVHRRVALGA